MQKDELLALPVTVDLKTAGRAFGLGRTRAYELARAGEFPCRVIPVGRKFKVPRSALLEALGIKDNATGPEPAALCPGPARSGEHYLARSHFLGGAALRWGGFIVNIEDWRGKPTRHTLDTPLPAEVLLQPEGCP